MKVLFIYSLDDVQSTLKPLRNWTSMQFGISYISSVLKKKGHRTRLLVLGSNRFQKSKKLCNSFIEEFDPNLVCFTAAYSQYFFTETIARSIKNQWPDKFLLIGGVHATLNPEEVIKGPFDALCIGEGEYPTLELCSQIAKKESPRGIANLWIISHNGRVEKNDPRDFIGDIDTLPLPDRDIWKPWIREELGSEQSVLLGRGCPYKCSYCCNHAISQATNGRYVRLRSPQSILNEIAFLHSDCPNLKIFFEVETMALRKAWALEICSQLEKYNSSIGNSISYGCNFRISPNSMDEELFIAFKKANFDKLNIGLESGSERIRREVLKRNYSNKDFLKTVSLACKHGLKVYVFNMIGLPGETFAEHMETVLLNRRIQPDGHFTGIFYPYPGTEIHDLCIKQGLLKSKVDSQMERKEAIIELPGFTKAQIQNAYTWFNYRVYKGHKPLWFLFIVVVADKIRSNATAYFIFRNVVQWPILRQLRTYFISH